MGEAVRVDRMDQDHRRVRLRVPVVVPVLEPGDLAARAAIAFDAVRGRDQQQALLRAPRPDPGDVRGEVAAVRSLQRMGHGLDELGAGGIGRLQELLLAFRPVFH